MGEGLKIVNEIYRRAKQQEGCPDEAYLGIDVAVLVLTDPRNSDLWKRLVEYCEEEHRAKRTRSMTTYSGSIQFCDVGLDAESHRAFPGSLDDTSNIEMSQAYFWTEEWQQGERRAEADIDAGRITWLAGTDIDAHFEIL